MQTLAIKTHSGYTDFKKFTDSVSDDNVVLFQSAINFMMLQPPEVVFGRLFCVPSERERSVWAGPRGAQRHPARRERKKSIFSAKRQVIWFETHSVSL